MPFTVTEDYLHTFICSYVYLFVFGKKRMRVERHLVHSCFQDNPTLKDHCNSAGLLFCDYVSHASLILRIGQHRLSFGVDLFSTPLCLALLVS